MSVVAITGISAPADAQVAASLQPTDAALPSGAVKVADENTNVLVRANGNWSVYYGAGDRYRKLDGGAGSHPVACNNLSFGDPKPGWGKACYTVGAWKIADQCAGEGGSCSGPGDMIYGVLGATSTKQIVGSATCNTQTFGGDPAPYKPKGCYLDSRPPANATKIADEGNGVLLTGTTWTVYYGAVEGGWAVLTGSGRQPVDCNVATFGRDPAFGKSKHCVAVNAQVVGSSCASDGGTCPGGARGQAVYGVFGRSLSKEVTGEFACGTNLGSDPAPGRAKKCYFVRDDATPPVGAETVADEGEHVLLTGNGTWDVYYGEHTKFMLKKGSGTRPMQCSPSTFGGDPSPGVRKSCQAVGVTRRTATHCGGDGSVCAAGVGTVVYGALTGAVERAVTGPVECSSLAFPIGMGSDPAPFTAKQCFFIPSGGSAPSHTLTATVDTGALPELWLNVSGPANSQVTWTILGVRNSSSQSMTRTVTLSATGKALVRLTGIRKEYSSFPISIVGDSASSWYMERGSTQYIYLSSGAATGRATFVVPNPQ